jgi:hypothetical protein
VETKHINFIKGLLMNDSPVGREEFNLLIGQLSADALVRDALLISLMEVTPDLHARLESKVAATAPVALFGLPEPQRAECRRRLSEVLELLRNA